jgi:alkylation response protein AidB-like acyl-CoA dehydrogenase
MRCRAGAPKVELTFTKKEEALRSEVRAFLKEHLPEDATNAGGLVDGDDDHFQAAKKFNAALAERGWIAPAWPKEYGGLGASIYEQMVFNEELGYVGAPDTGTRGFGVGMIGPTLIVHGTEAQKREHLPRITSGEAIWCQGYSEPGSGSDLASLQTRAVLDGDDYVINGQKIWTSGGHRANWMFLLARTDPEAPKHRGISFFLLDIKNTPGVDVQPLINMADRHHFNQVFFDNVRVPRGNLVGEENRGWYVGMTLLDFERSRIGTTAAQKRTLERLAAWLARQPAAKRQRLRANLAELVIENNVGRFLGYRIGDMQARGLHPSYEASVIKVFQSELSQRIYRFGVNALGLPGQLRPEQANAPFGGEMPEGYLLSVPMTIYSGSNEIQRNIIAERGLGLPRS